MPDLPMIRNVLRFSSCFVAAALAVASSTQAQVHFTPEERTKIIEYWSVPGRYSYGWLPDAPKTGSWRARQSVEGSYWLWRYQRALSPGKTNPLATPTPANREQAVWEAWIDRKCALDLALAEREAADRNAEELGRPSSPAPLPPDPGPIPGGLERLVGAPPSFASAVQPRIHQVAYEDDGLTLAYEDNLPMRRRYAYYRFAEGIRSVGQRVKSIPESSLRSLFSDAGLSRSEMNIMKAVSLLEGGFDSINTYDTGYVSAGFIQFAALQGGSGSLGAVLLELKRESFVEFDRAFRRYGIEATPAGELVALCPSSGAEFIGPQAALKIISDRRLASVFQRAGRLSRLYQVAQLKTARRLYYPGDDVIRITRQGRAETAKVREVFRSEAGIATLMDRKVNTGSLGRLNEVIQAAVERTGVEDLSELSAMEFNLVKAMRWRKDYLSDPSLSRPSLQARDGSAAASRSGSRSGRRTAKKPAAVALKSAK